MDGDKGCDAFVTHLTIRQYYVEIVFRRFICFEPGDIVVTAVPAESLFIDSHTLVLLSLTRQIRKFWHVRSGLCVPGDWEPKGDWR